MNTIKNLIGSKILTLLSTVFLMVLANCSDNVIDYTATDDAYIQSEINSDAQTEETDDMAALVISSDAATLNGRESDGREEVTVSDDRFNCATVTLDRATLNNPPVNTILNPHGFITVDFGNGCTGPGGRTRAGKIIYEYQGRRFAPGSKIVTTFVNYSVNGIKLEGTITLTNTSSSETAAVSYSIVENGIKVTYPNGTFATRTSSTIRTWNRTANPTGDTWTVTGSAAGTNRKGKDYVMTITTELLYKRSCAVSNKVFIPVQGIKELKVDGKTMTIDFGDGSCNTNVKVSLLGKSKDVEPSADGN